MAHQTSISLSELPMGIGNSNPVLHKNILDLFTKYRDAWEINDYQAVRDMSYEFYGRATDVLQRVELLTYIGTIDRELADGEDAAISKSFKDINNDNSPEGELVKKAILDQLKKDLPASEVDAAYAALLGGEHPLFDLAITNSKSMEAETDLMSSEYISLITFGSATDYIGYFRTGKDAISSTREIGDADTKIISNLAKTIKRLNKKAYKKMYGGLSSGMSEGALYKMANLYQNKLQKLFGIAGSLLGPYLALNGNSSDAASKVKAYKAALKLSEAITRAYVTLAYASYLKVNLSVRSYNRWLSNERRRTTNRTLSSNVDKGAKISIADLVDEGSQPDEGTLVLIEGIVKSIGIKEEEDSKFSTFVTLEDLESGATVLLRAHMFGLEDNGLSAGSYAKINGFVRKGKDWLDPSQVGLDIDRVNLTELSKDNWLDDVTDRMKGYSLLYQDGMNMFFTSN